MFRTGPFAASPIAPSMLVIGKGLAAGLCKHAAIVVDRNVLHQAVHSQKMGRSLPEIERSLPDRILPTADSPAANPASSLTVAQPVPPCALCCAVASVVLDEGKVAVLAERARTIQKAVDTQAARALADGWLIPVRGGGFSYEFELRATATIRSASVRPHP